MLGTSETLAPVAGVMLPSSQKNRLQGDFIWDPLGGSKIPPEWADPDRNVGPHMFGKNEMEIKKEYFISQV